MTTAGRVSAALLPVAIILSACGSTSGAGSRELVVSAAASLTDAFAEIEAAFEDANPEIDVVLNLGASSALREQILAGAPADVFASANRRNMDLVAEEGLVQGEPRIFALNELQIAVPTGNPAGIQGLDDFAADDLLIGLCAEEVPCGDFGRQALDAAGVVLSIDSNEPNVRSLLTKIGEGELDAGIVYVTDVAGAGNPVDGIDIPNEFNVVAEYPIAVLSGATEPDAAGAFADFVLSEEGREILAAFGFRAP